MPISPVLISTVEVVMKGVIASAGSTAVNTAFVFHYTRGSTSPVLSKAAFHTAFVAAVEPSLLAATNARWSQTINDVRWLDDALDQYQSFTRTGVGAIATDSLPTDAAVYCLCRTGLRGRSYRGSKHFAPASEVDTTGDVLVAPGLTRWQAVAAAVAVPVVDGNGNTWLPSVFSRLLSQVRTNPTTVITNPITQVLLNERIGSMNRRKAASVY
jgi:hypothetical protein